MTNITNMGVHDEEVLRQALMYSNEGYIVEADIDGWTRPILINGYRPDVIAWQGDSRTERIITRIIIEIETSRSVESNHTKHQREAFERAVIEDSVNRFIFVVIPWYRT